MSNGMDPCVIHRRPTESLKMFHHLKPCQVGFWEGQRQDEIKEGCQTPRILQAGNRLIKLLSCKHVLPFREKEEWLEGGSSGPRGLRPVPRLASAGTKARAMSGRLELHTQDGASSLRGLVADLKPSGWTLLEFETAWDQWPHSSFIFSLLEGECLWLLSYAYFTIVVWKQIAYLPVS